MAQVSDDETMSVDSGHVTVFSEDFNEDVVEDVIVVSDDEGPASPEDAGCTPDSCFFYALYRTMREGYANVVVENAQLTLRLAEAEAELVTQKRKVKKLEKKAVKHAEKKRARKAKRAVKKMAKVIKRKLRSGREF